MGHDFWGKGERWGGTGSKSSHAPACFHSHALREVPLIYDEEPLLILALSDLRIHHLFLQQKNRFIYKSFTGASSLLLIINYYTTVDYRMFFLLVYTQTRINISISTSIYRITHHHTCYEYYAK